jgi:hypothetical protein
MKIARGFEEVSSLLAEMLRKMSLKHIVWLFVDLRLTFVPALDKQ